MTAVETLLARLIDDAGQFPPARKPLERAVDDHLAARASEHGWMLGRFLCPASRLRDGLPRPLGVVGDGDWREDLGAAVRQGADVFELKDPGPDAYASLAAAPLRVFVEASSDLEALRDAGLGAKLRCGGLTAAAFPSDDVVAAFVAECRRLDLPFKATAGLHHPFRRPDEATGVLQHGFVNLLAAATLDADDVQPIVEETDPDAFSIGPRGLTWRDVSATAEDVARGRELLVSYGSCSFAEPVDDLVRFGVLPVHA